MSDPDFDQEATVSWSDGPVVGDVHGGIGNTRPFATLREAVKFATEGVPEHLRGNVWVMTEGHTYNPSALAELKAKLN